MRFDRGQGRGFRAPEVRLWLRFQPSGENLVLPSAFL
jgi:hypothetical protein